jgi:valyl-tRNA synthetase
MRATLAYVLEGSLRLMHPLIPFVTEELWQRVPHPSSRKVSIAFGPYPTPADERAARDPEVDAWMDLLKGCISAARTVRSEHDIDKKAGVDLAICSDNSEVLGFLREHAPALALLVKTKGAPVFEGPSAPRPPGTTVSMVSSSFGAIEVRVGLKGLVDPAEEQQRIERELKKIAKDLAALEKKLSSPGFVDRAPKEVVEESNAQRATLLEAKARLEAARQLVGEL